jgi:hypothetical protein
MRRIPASFIRGLLAIDPELSPLRVRFTLDYLAKARYGVILVIPAVDLPGIEPGC